MQCADQKHLLTLGCRFALLLEEPPISAADCWFALVGWKNTAQSTYESAYVWPAAAPLHTQLCLAPTCVNMPMIGRSLMYSGCFLVSRPAGCTLKGIHWPILGNCTEEHPAAIAGSLCGSC